MRSAAAIVAVAALATLGWALAGLALGVAEPWDAPRYPLALAVAIGLAGMAGYLAPASAGWWGVIAIVAQVPPLLLAGHAGALFAVGLLILLVECVPAVAAAFLGAALRR